MAKVELKIITPAQIVREEIIDSITVPSAEGEITILPRHENLFTLLKEGIITIRKEKSEDEYYAIGEGYLETDGKSITILVSEAYNEDLLNAKQVEEAVERAKTIVSHTKETVDRASALASLRRAELDVKLLQKRKGRRNSSVVQ